MTHVEMFDKIMFDFVDAANRRDEGAVRRLARELVALDRDWAAMFAQAIEISLLPEAAGSG